MSEVKKHFVEFFSPGTFVSEVTARPMDDGWDVDAAVAMADEIFERHGATPYGFRFITKTRGKDDLDSKVTGRSGVYYLGGRIETREEIEDRNDPREVVLRTNMRANDINRVIVNDNSWRFTGPLNDEDVVLDYTPPARPVSALARAEGRAE